MLGEPGVLREAATSRQPQRLSTPQHATGFVAPWSSRRGQTKRSFRASILVPYVSVQPASPSANHPLRRVILVTGANKGIGYEIAKRLLTQREDVLVLLGCRDRTRGEAAVSALKKQQTGWADRVELLLLDVQSDDSVADAAKQVASKYGRLDVLVNNAGVAWKQGADQTSFTEALNPFDRTVVTDVMGANYFGVLRTTQAFLPLLRKSSSGRVVNLSSMDGAWTLRNMSPELLQKMMSEDLIIQGLNELMDQFIEDVSAGVSDAAGWPHTTYGVSKAGCSMLTRIMARDEMRRWEALSKKEQEGTRPVLINACCPGWCVTDLAGPHAPLPVEDGAITPVVLALLPSDSTITGSFWQDGRQDASFTS
eukprot:gb/GEZN01004937.1/.p1 GENE.gb/GEZN01004937.1/~~gb/GEZN01004937.1/.p1  ORF type:complete len:367 (+),score=49.53 gb/GEZN01004937.1/:489-1589(+)